MCCKKIKDILHPFNIFGKDRRNFVIDLPDGYNSVPMAMEWTGERVIVRYTRIWSPPKKYPHGEPYTLVFEDANMREDTFTVVRAQNIHEHVGCKKIYLDCTNVTSLIVNGETLI